MDLSRRGFLESSTKLTALLPARKFFPIFDSSPTKAEGSSAAKNPSSVLDVDLRRLVSRADLDYQAPATRSEDGQPIGNGAMGSLVWTEPTALRLQINRADVYAENCETNSFPERDTDYGSGCGFVEVDFGDFGEDVFSGSAFRQQLSVYDGISSVQGEGVSAQIFACQGDDVIAIEIDDRRAQPAPIKTDLRMLRFVVQYLIGENFPGTQKHAVKVVNRNHSAASTLGIPQGRISLLQEFREGKYYNSSAVVIQVVGRKSKAKYVNESVVRLGTPAARGKFTILIASAASFDPQTDVVAKAGAALDNAAKSTTQELAQSNSAWWHDFWSKAFVCIETSDPQARQVELNYTYNLYVMGASSRGKYAPRFGGMLWFTNADMREWGSQHWFHNLSCNYNSMPAANRPELMQPFLSLYAGMYDRCALAARQQWGSQGIFLPETVWFDGLEQMPESLAAEMPGLYLMQKPWEKRSQEFRDFAEPKMPHNSRWNFKDKGQWINGHYVWKDRGIGPYGPVTHILSSGAKIAHLFWQHYEHTQDREYLAKQGYPILKGVAEFYRNFPNLNRGADGKYHIHHVNNHEPVQDATDTQEELSAMHGLFPVAIRAARTLGVDADLQTKWQEVVDDLAPLPTNRSENSPRPYRTGDAEVWIAGLPPVVRGNIAALVMIPGVYFDLCCIETEDARTKQLGQQTFDAVYRNGVDSSVKVPELSADSTVAAHLGRADALRFMLPNQIDASATQKSFCDLPGSGLPAVLMNRMTLREGPGAIGVERLGRMSEALQEALLQSNPPRPGGDPIVHVFSAWPKEWDASFSLSARGGFSVTSSFRQGRVEFVEIESRAGNACRLRNPWGAQAVALYRDGKPAETLRQSLLQFETRQGERIVAAPEGTALSSLRRSV
jgi:hypothetical protein